MSKQDFEIRFDKARTRLNGLLKDLEKTITDKLHETATQSRMMQVSTEDDSADARITKQFITIQNLSSEINKLQENLATLGKENDSLIEENESLHEDLTKIKNQSSTLISAIESDLVSIEEIIAGAKND